MEPILDDVARTLKVKEDLPRAGSILTTGIISIPLCTGLIGIILSIITLTRAKEAMELYREYPDQYTESSYNRVNAGKICAIVSLSLCGLIILLLVAANA